MRITGPARLPLFLVRVTKPVPVSMFPDSSPRSGNTPRRSGSSTSRREPCIRRVEGSTRSIRSTDRRARRTRTGSGCARIGRSDGGRRSRGAQPQSPTWVTAPEAVTAASSCLAGRINRKHDRQCSDCHKYHLFRTSQLVHGDTSLSPPTPWDAMAPLEIQVAATQRPATAALLIRAMQSCAGLGSSLRGSSSRGARAATWQRVRCRRGRCGRV